MSCATAGFVGGGAESAAERGAVEHESQGADHRDRDGELQQRQHADIDAAEQGIVATSIRRPAPDAAAVKAVRSPFWMINREAERTSSGAQETLAERAVEHEPLQRIADRSHHPAPPGERGERADAERFVRPVRYSADTTIKSPCAILTSRITPKISDSPAANMAKSPPTSTPCRMTLIQSTVSHPDNTPPRIARASIPGGAGKRDAPLRQAIDACAARSACTTSC